MCDIGGILGTAVGAALSLFAPEFGIPLALASGGGGFLGSTAESLAEGKPFGQALEKGAVTGAISGATAGAGNALGGGEFFGAPAGDISSFFGAASPEAAATTAGTAGTSIGGANIAPLAGGEGIGAPLTAGAAGPGAATGGGIGASVGAEAPQIGGALSSLPQSLGEAGPAGSIGPAGAIGPSTGIGSPGYSSLSPSAQVSADVGPVTGNNLVSGGGTGIPGIGTGADIPGATAGLYNAPAADAGAGGFGNKALDFAKNNPALLLAGGGLAASTMFNRTPPGLENIKGQAATLSAAGTPLLNSLKTGALPPGGQASLDQGTSAAKATVRNRFAGMGLSGSSQEADALASVDQAAAASKYNELLKSAELGLRETGQANELYKTILTTQLSQDQATQQAIARLAAALAGGGVTKAAA